MPNYELLVIWKTMLYLIFYITSYFITNYTIPYYELLVILKYFSFSLFIYFNLPMNNTRYFTNNEDMNSRKRRVCNKMYKIEKTPGHGDTSGWEELKNATVTRDHRGTLKLNLPRSKTSNRLVQTSIYLSRGWRANVDIQLLLHDCNEEEICSVDVAGVTDYIVGYICKGNESQVQEKANMKELVMDSTSVCGDLRDVKRVARHLLNQSAKNRVVSKQEAMCHLGGLDLYLCSESIRDVSLSGQFKIGTDMLGYKNELVLYADRIDDDDLSFHKWFTKRHEKNVKKKIIPNYVGGRVDPVFPVSGSYARSIMLVHIPWKKQFILKDSTEQDLITNFFGHLEDNDFPPSVTIPYYREKLRIEDGNKFCEPTSDFDHDNDFRKHAMENNPDLVDLVELAGSLPCHVKENEMHYGFEYDVGLNHDWSEQEYKCEMSADKIETWLEEQLENKKTNKIEIGIGEPIKSDGTKYYIDGCYDDKKEAIAHVLKTIKEWIEHVENTITKTFEPLRLTICGVAGSGKTVYINTLVSMIRRIFQNKDSVVVCAGTGSAAYNAGGVTFHSYFKMSDKSYTMNMDSEKHKTLMNNMKDLVALIIDERSLVGAKNLGMMEDNCKNCAFKGQQKELNFGGLPIVIVVGDDYQLPSIEVGAFHALDKEYKNNMAKNNKMTHAERNCIHNGFDQFINLGKKVIFLQASKRTHIEEIRLHRMLTAARCENHTDCMIDKDIDCLIDLHLEDLSVKYTSKEQQELKENGVCLFAKKEPRNIHNAEMLA